MIEIEDKPRNIIVIIVIIKGNKIKYLKQLLLFLVMYVNSVLL